MLDKVLGKIKVITGIEKFGNIKILIDIDDKLLDNITSENVLVFMTCVIKDDNIFIHNYFQKKLFK